MAMQSSWVEHLFGKLTVRWGSAFMRQWPDVDPSLVKADWAEVLDGTRSEALHYALRYLPALPCNAIQFRDLCRRAPREDAPALPAPRPPADPERAREILARFQEQCRFNGDKGQTLAETCVENILRCVAERGGVMSIPQRQQMRAMGFNDDGTRMSSTQEAAS